MTVKTRKRGAGPVQGRPIRCETSHCGRTPCSAHGRAPSAGSDIPAAARLGHLRPLRLGDRPVRLRDHAVTCSPAFQRTQGCITTQTPHRSGADPWVPGNSGQSTCWSTSGKRPGASSSPATPTPRPGSPPRPPRSSTAKPPSRRGHPPPRHHLRLLRQRTRRRDREQGVIGRHPSASRSSSQCRHLRRLPHRQGALPGLRARAGQRLADRHRHHRGRLPPHRQGQNGHHRRQMGPRRRRRHPQTPRPAQQRRLRRLLGMAPRPRAATRPSRKIPRPRRPRRMINYVLTPDWVPLKELHPEKIMQCVGGFDLVAQYEIGAGISGAGGV